MHQAPGEAVQKVCPRCGALAYTGAGHCPWCGGGYRRRIWPALLVCGLVTTALTLARDDVPADPHRRGARRTLDSEVDRVQRDLDRSFEDVRRSVREELDARLPPAP